MSVPAARKGSGSLRGVVIDAALVLLLAGVVVAHLAGGIEPTARDPDALAYLIGLAGVGALAGRRRWPVVVAAFVLVCQFAYHGLGYPGAGPSPAFLVALYTAAAYGHRGEALMIAGIAALASTLFQTLDEGSELLAASVIMPIIAWSAAVFLGEAVHNRRAYAAEVRERLRRAETEREQEALRRVTEERLRIARELHDVVAHTIGVITVQAGVAEDLFEDRPEEARAALRTIRSASREATSELKATIGVLRGANGAGDPRAPAPGLEQVDHLIEAAAGGGLRVKLDVSGERRPLPAPVDLAAYRIIQESLTNVLRHAHASAADVALTYGPDAIEVTVADDGRGPQVSSANGHGLIGMKERATAVDGWLEAGPGPNGGFTVRAHLPTGGA
jgi:signal transduction histidine kinase